MVNRIRTLILAAIAAACLAVPALALDKVHLKDGRVLEGEITREGDGYLYITVRVGSLQRAEFVLKANVERIERDVDATPEDKDAGGTPATPAPETSPNRTASPRPAPADPNARRIAFITLEEMVGPFMNARALAHSIDLLEDDKPEIVVLQINSGGGIGLEVQKLSDVIEHKIKPKYRVVAWVESAISAAAMTAWTCEEIYMMKEGNIGAATGYRMLNGRAEAVEGEELEMVLRQMEQISERGNHNPLVMRAMQVPTNLSADIDPSTGAVTWRNDLSGQYIVSTEKQILTFNSIDAVRFGVARAIADNKDELARALGCSSWVEVGADADEYQVRFREDVQQAQVRAAEILSKMQIALNAGNVGRARAMLGQLRGWARRATSLEEYGAPDFGVPPLDAEFFRRVEEQLDQLAKQRAGR